MTLIRSGRAVRARPPRAASVLTAIGVGSLLALGVALIAQHGFGIEPCPWCVIQRLVVIVVAIVALVGAGLAGVAPRGAPAVAALGIVGLATGGMLAAWHQHTVAAKTLSCAFTWADRTLMSLQLDAIWPSLFKVGATCADAAQALLLGLPFEVWSGVWFGLVAVAALYAMVLAVRRNWR
jgi:protein dithiol:quinone oxidoreductase